MEQLEHLADGTYKGWNTQEEGKSVGVKVIGGVIISKKYNLIYLTLHSDVSYQSIIPITKTQAIEEWFWY